MIFSILRLNVGRVGMKLIALESILFMDILWVLYSKRGKVSVSLLVLFFRLSIHPSVYLSFQLTHFLQ